MSIRYANSKDFNQIQALWDISFPEEPIFNKWFFKEIYKPENTLLSCSGGKICAMLQMFPYQMKIEDRVYPVHYIYGVCTHPDYRKRGLMEQLLNDACLIGKDRGDFASILIPQEEWLFEIYEKFGYQSGFFIHRINFTVENSHLLGTLVEASEPDINKMAHLYDEQTKDQSGVILRRQEYWVTQIAMFKSTGGNVYCLKENGKFLAYGFVGFLEDKLWIQEGLGTNYEALLSLAEQVAMKNNKQNVTILTSQLHQGERLPLGCIKFLDNSYHKEFSGYMNLMFN